MLRKCSRRDKCPNPLFYTSRTICTWTEGRTNVAIAIAIDHSDYAPVNWTKLCAFSLTLLSQCVSVKCINSQNDVPKGLESCGSSKSGRYIPSAVRSSVESRASNWGSLTRSPRTNSRDRRAVAAGKDSDALRRRFANAAVRTGDPVPAARTGKTSARARKRRSAVVCRVMALLLRMPALSRGPDSMSGCREIGRIRA
jgi:hypothetical protein